MDGKHFYSTMPENAHRKVLVGIHAHTIDILTEGGQVVTTHRRAFSEGRTDVSNHSTTLVDLMKNSGAWENSGLRRETPDALRAYMDAQSREKLKDSLRIMNELINQYGFQAAVSAMEMTCARGNINICDASVLAARITGYGIYTYKTFECYSYQSVKFPLAFCREELESLEFIPSRTNLVLYGLVGVGKPHMAIAAGVKACDFEHKTNFYTLTELVFKLSESRKNGTLERFLRNLRSLDLLILDEWGYVPADKDGLQLLFRVISDSYESKSQVLTTNLEFSKWGAIFTDDQMAAAMIERLGHHGHLLIFEGKSYRMEHAFMRRDV